MREMKDTGVEWVGKIPLNHTIRKIKHCIRGLTDGTHGTFQRVENGKYLLSAKNVFEKGLLIGDKESLISEQDYHEITKNGYPQKGDILLCCVGTVGRCMIYDRDEPIAFQRSVIFIRCNNKIILPKMMFYCLQTSPVNIQERLAVNKSAQEGIYQGAVSNIYIVFPKLITEQESIITYLDSKCSKIDSIIEKQKQIIEKLKEYKTSLTTEVVTKGLDPNVEMKDSGVEWIGKIPKHWNVLKLKFLFEDGNSGLKIGPYGSALKGKTLDKGPYKIYNQAHLIQNDFSISRHYISEETFNELSNYEVRPGDILFSMMGTIGKCRIMPQNQIPGIMDSHLLKSRLNKKILDNFFVYAYDKDYSNQVIDQLKFLSAGTIMDGLNSKILKNIYIAVPPIEEQNQILDYLDSKCSQIDTSITKKELIVEKLQEYKKSIIYEVVTGKREV